MIICYYQFEGGVQRTNDYEYQAIEPSDAPLVHAPADDFGEENVRTIAPGIVACYEDERDDGDRAVIVVDTNRLAADPRPTDAIVESAIKAAGDISRIR